MIFLLQEYEEGFDFIPVQTLTNDVFYIQTTIMPVPEIYLVTNDVSCDSDSCRTIIAWLYDNLDIVEYKIDIKDIELSFGIEEIKISLLTKEAIMAFKLRWL